MSHKNPINEYGELFCNGCKHFFPPTAFGKNAQRRNGLSHQCRGCVRRRHEEWRRGAGIRTKEEYLASVRKPGFCSDCNEWKNLYEFNKNASRPNGIQNICKSCTQKRNIREWWINVKGNPEKHAKVKAKTNAYMRRYRGARTADPIVRQKHIVRSIVSLAMQGGFLKRLPCEVCGETKVQGHHDDYSKPLEVRWLCRTHHNEVHQHR